MSCGEPAGIGPELAAKAHSALGTDLPFFWIGDPLHLPPGTRAQHIDAPEEAAEAAKHGLPVLPLSFPAPALPGLPEAENAPPVIAAIEKAVALTVEGRAGGVVTMPIHKQALVEGAAFRFPGHTEFLAHLAGVRDVVMMLASPMLKVVPATIHIPLASVPQRLTPRLLETVIRITARDTATYFGPDNPVIAVAGLNPHAGEGGVLGEEEVAWITPLLERLRGEGFNLVGPMSADTMFHAEARARYDVAIAMYHDQALIPIKTLDFSGGVNVTLGLPFVRTSPDHGTAFDIAGSGTADVTSTLAALRLAARMAERRAG